METKSKKNRRRLSILKRSPSSNEINLDSENQCVSNENTTHRRFSKRVSFADSHQIKEIIRVTDIAQDWHDSNSDCDTSKLSDVSNLMPPLPKRQSLSVVSSTDYRLSTINDEENDSLNKTSGSCDMDMTSLSSSNPLEFSSRAKARPGLLSFFDNSTLNIGGAYVPSPQESPQDPDKLTDAEQSHGSVYGELSQKKNDGIKLQDFLQSVKCVNSVVEVERIKEKHLLPRTSFPGIPPPSYHKECVKGRSSQSLLMGPQVGSGKRTTEAELDQENAIHLQHENTNRSNLSPFIDNENVSNVSDDMTKIFTNASDVHMDFTECRPVAIATVPPSAETDDIFPSEDDTTDVRYDAQYAATLEDRENVTKIFKSAEDIQMDFTECAPFGSVLVSHNTSSGYRNAIKTVESSLSPYTHPTKDESDLTRMSVGQMDFTECRTVQVILSELPDSKETGKLQGLDSSPCLEEVKSSPNEKTRHFVQDQDDGMEFTGALPGVLLSSEKTLESGDKEPEDADDKTRHFTHREDNDMDFTEACVGLVQEGPLEVPEEDASLKVNDKASCFVNKQPENQPIPDNGYIRGNSSNEDIPHATNSDDEETFTNILSLKRKISRVRNSIGIYKAKSMKRSATSSSEDYDSPQEDVAKQDGKDDLDSFENLGTSELSSEVFTKDCSANENIKTSANIVCLAPTGDLEKLPGNNTFVASEDGESSCEEAQGTTGGGGGDAHSRQMTSEDIQTSEEDILCSQPLFDETIDNAEALAYKEFSRSFNEPASTLPKCRVQMTEEVERPCPANIQQLQEKDSSRMTSEITPEQNAGQQVPREDLKDSEETDLRLRQTGLDKSLMASLNLQQSQKHVENISVEDFLDLAKVRIWSKQWKNLGRQSNIMPEPKNPPGSLFEWFLAVKLKGAELSLQEWFVESMEKTASWLEEEITKKEENISAKNPEIFHKLRLGADDDKLVEAIRKMTTQQKNLAKAYWNFDVSKLKKGLCKDTELFLDKKLLPLVNKLGQPQKLLDSALAEIEEGNKELDKLLSELKAKDEPPSQSQADEYERACSELDNLNKKYTSVQSQKASAKERDEEYRKRQAKLLNDFISKDEDAVGKKHASQKKVIRDYEKHLLWRLHSVSQRSIEFAFFSGTLVISVQFETEWNSSPYAKVASYSVRSVISNENVIKSEIATFQMINGLMKRHMVTEDFLNKYPDFRSLRLLLHCIGGIASAAKEFLSDIDWISCQVSSCSCDVLLDEECIVISFLPPVLGVDRFTIKFHFPIKESLTDLNHDDLLQLVIKNGFRYTHLEYIGGRRQLEYMNDQEMNKLCKSVSPGRHHLKRTVQALLTKLNYQK